MFLADLYRVTCGGTHLKVFVTRTAAIKYAADVVDNSHPRVGAVRVEGRDERGTWRELLYFGVPRNGLPIGYHATSACANSGQ